VRGVRSTRVPAVCARRAPPLARRVRFAIDTPARVRRAETSRASTAMRRSEMRTIDVRTVVFGLAVSVALFPAVAARAPSALGHGGAFQGPDGSAPPCLPEPSAPPPPPPAPPSVAQDRPGETLRTPSIGSDDWTTWFAQNLDARWPIDRYRTRVSGGPLSAIGGAGGDRGEAWRAARKATREEIRPALLRATDPRNRVPSDLESAAHLALARVTEEPEDVERIQRAVRDPSRALAVRESAALALGLLRRTDEARRFDAKEYDRVRDFAFAAFEDEGLPIRTRAFAMLSIGTLGDMPTRHGASDPAKPGATARIADLLRTRWPAPDLPVALLLALSLQPPATVPETVRRALEDAMLHGRLGGEETTGLVRSYAALALGRVGTSAQAVALRNALSLRGLDLRVARSAAISLGSVGRRLGARGRAELATELVARVEAVQDASVARSAVLSLAALLEADVEAGRTDVLEARGKPAEFLLRAASDGAARLRPFAALALGIVGRAIGERADVAAYAALRLEAIQTLKDGLLQRSLDERSRAAFAASLGILRDSSSRRLLMAIVSDSQGDREIRGYAAVALGMIGEPTPDVVRAIRTAMQESGSEELHLPCATALGYLGHPETVPLLLRELVDSETQAVQGRILLALGRIGDARAIPPLVAILRHGEKPDRTRALACLSLGLVGDPERIPSLARLRRDLDHRATCDAVAEVLTIP
jgi:HEAT repeat protein